MFNINLLEILEENPNGLDLDSVRVYIYQLLKAIEYCEFRKQAESKRKPHSATPPKQKATKPGQLLVIDAYGPYATPSAGLHCQYLIGGRDEASGKAFTQQKRHHTTEEYIKFRRACSLRRARSPGPTSRTWGASAPRVVPTLTLVL